MFLIKNIFKIKYITAFITIKYRELKILAYDLNQITIIEDLNIFNNRIRIMSKKESKN
jgi:hypothetical protein